MSSKKVLIISYYWAPAGGPGVQRWLKFVKYLPCYDVLPIVYVPSNPTYPIIDNELQKEVSDDVVILRHKIFEPYQIASFLSKKKTKTISSGIIPNRKKQTLLDKLFLWIRGNVFIPDARVFWVKPSVRFLEKYIRENKIDTIITTGPPHSLHLIGLQLKDKLRVRWIADFRDPWTTIGYHKSLMLSQCSMLRHIALERKVLVSADTILVTSETTKRDFELLTDKPIEVITNGYDTEIITHHALDNRFSLAHIGSFLSDRNPRILWKCLSELGIEVPNFANKLEIKLLGAVSQEVLDSIAEFGLLASLNNLGYVSHQEAILHQRCSQLLLLIEIDSRETKSIIPGKLFEYMVAGRPIVGIGPEQSDFAEIIRETNTGEFFNYTEKARLKEHILECYNLYLEGKLTVQATGLERYSRSNLTKRLAEIINKN